MEELTHLPGEERILKNLFLQDDKKRRYYLVAIDGQRPDGRPEGPAPDTGQPSSRFADAADLERLLGLLPGQVTAGPSGRLPARSPWC